MVLASSNVNQNKMAYNNSWFNERDSNRDNQLQYVEIERGRTGASRQGYDQADLNGDGRLSREETAVYLQKAREAEDYAAKMRREVQSTTARHTSGGQRYFFPSHVTKLLPCPFFF